jgi:hypothetical protein
LGRAEATQKRFQLKGEGDGSGSLKISRKVEMGGKMVDEVDVYDPIEQLIHTHREWSEDGQEKEYDYFLRVYTIEQYKQMFAKAGLKFVDLWGDFQANPHNTNGNLRTIILAQK